MRLSLVVECDVALFQDLAHIVGQITTTERDLNSGVRNRIAFKDGHDVRDLFTRVNDTASGPSRGEQSEHCLKV